MPYARPTLTDLRTQAKQDIATDLQGSDPLLRFNNLYISADVVAGMSDLHYGYLDWIAAQAVPFTATDEFLQAWAALKKVYPLPATQASGSVRFPGTNGTDLPSGTLAVRGDGVLANTTADAVVTAGYVTAPAKIQADPTGLTGAFGNCDAGTSFSLGTSISGIQAKGTAFTDFTGGSDLESQDSLKTRMIQAYQTQASGGNQSDYVTWALQVPGVTRAWCVPNVYGPGTVIVYFMMDQTESVHGGFPQGTNGVASSETRDTAATGDQLTVANYIYPLRPVTALVYSAAPTSQTQNFTIAGSSGFSTTVKNAINAAIDDALLRLGSAEGDTVNLSDINEAIGAVPGSSGFIMTVPSSNIAGTVGKLPVRGTTTWAP